MTEQTGSAAPYSDLISGEWLLDASADADECDGNVYTMVYPALVVRHVSYGVEAVVSRRTMEAIVSDNERMRSSNPDLDSLVWDDDVVVHTAPVVDPSFAQRIAPDAAGQYQVPGWTWCAVDRDRDWYSGVSG